jgi:[acyl-carrier-protein] S-malonyltransferase
MSTAFLFPGQGAQSVGMGQDFLASFPPAEEMFVQAEAASGLPLRTLCFEGPEEDLARTDVAQPAIFTVSAIALEALRATRGGSAPQPDALAGLSLGEYTALYAAGAMDFETGVQLVAKRGQLMQDAATATPSGMVSVIGLDEIKAQELCAAAAEGQHLTCANFNCPGQIVLSGERAACERATELAEQFGASGAVPLKVAGAFHSQIMAPAAEAFAEVLAGVAFSEPALPVIANVDAKPYAGAREIADRLLSQLTQPVRWQQSMEYLLAQGLGKPYEVGPGRVLAGLMRRIDRKTRVVNLNSYQAIDALAQEAAQQSPQESP